MRWLIVPVVIGLALIVWLALDGRREPGRHRGRIRRADLTGAGPGWSPADEVDAVGVSAELLAVQTAAERTAEMEAIAHPVDDATNRTLDDALASFGERMFSLALKPLLPDMADERAYLMRSMLHRGTGECTTDTKAMQFRAALDQMLAADGLDQLALAGAR